MKALFTLLIFVFTIGSGFSQSFSAGSKIEIDFGGTWYDGTLLSLQGAEYKVRYEGPGKSFDVVVAKTRVRARGAGSAGKPAKGLEIGTKVKAKSGGFLTDGAITAFKDGKYKVHFDGYGDAFDAWFTAEELGNGASTGNTAAITTNKANNAGTVATTPNQTATTNSVATGGNTIGVGSKVSAKQGTTWYAATIKEINNGQFLVKYDNYDEQEWVTADRIKPRTSLPADKLRGGSGSVYIRSLYDVISGTHEFSWWYFGDNGVVVWNPKHGANPLNLSAEQADNYNKVGTYGKQGNIINIAWISGATTNLKAEYRNNEFRTLDGGDMVRQTPFPDNYRLQGTFEGTMKYQSISAANTYTFFKDGRILVNNVGYVNGGGDFKGKSDETKKGTYTIKGHTLVINYEDGTKQTSLIGALSDKNLVIDSRSLLAK